MYTCTQFSNAPLIYYFPFFLSFSLQFLLGSRRKEKIDKKQRVEEDEIQEGAKTHTLTVELIYTQKSD